MTNKKILDQHPYSITLNPDGRYSTYVTDETKKSKRRKIVKPSRELLDKEIIKYYKEREKEKSLEKITLRKFYPEWFQYKTLHTTSSAYMRTIDQLWKRYYLNDPIIDRPLVDLDEYTLDMWVHSLIRQHNLTKTQYYNMAIIIRQSLDLAVSKKIIAVNCFSGIKVDYKMFKPIIKKPDTTQVFLIEEQPQIEQEAYNNFHEQGKSAALAIPFAFQTGMRMSEIVALRWSDIDEEQENCIHVQRMEVKEYNQLPDGTWGDLRRVVVDRTKTIQGNRNVYLTSAARDILATVHSFNEEMGYGNDGYIFMNENGRVTSPSLNRRIRRYCRKIGISEKSMHKIRKTYISTLIDSDEININYIREQVGHADARTTYGSYCYNRKSKNLTAQEMEKALVHH
ncbi:MAG: site-specific integrase [Lachnospiraceae bacterium]|nr:site-specific integrase [Lachnospiraceae bacterium]